MKKTLTNENYYIQLNFDEACKKKWEDGIKKYRKNKTDKFNGYFPEEVYSEAIDMYNYLSEWEREYGENFAIQKMMCKTIAAVAKDKHSKNIKEVNRNR